jgi:serine protease Do
MQTQRGLGAGSVVLLSLIFGLLGGGVGGWYMARKAAPAATAPMMGAAQTSPADSLPAAKVEVTTDQDAIVKAVHTMSPSVVKITGRREPRDWMEMMMSGSVISGVGSGFIFEYEGRKLVLTNTHVIGDFTDLTLKLTDGQELKARPLGRSQSQDLAVLEILDAPANLKAASLGDSDKLQPGQWVFALGNPFNFEHTVTVGVVSAVGLREIGGEMTKVVQTDASINAGNSGGPLCDLAGNVVGINYKIYDPQGNPVATSVGIGFAIPINQAKELLYFLVHRGPFVGIAHVMPNSQAFSHYFGIAAGEGIVIMGLYQGGPAEQAGLRVRDVVTAVDGQAVTTPDDMQKAIFKHRIGDQVRFTVLRGGRQVDVDVLAGTVPDDSAR